LWNDVELAHDAMVYATGGYTGGVASSSQKLFVSHMHRKPGHTWRASCTLTGTDNYMVLAVYVMVRGSNQRLDFFGSQGSVLQAAATKMQRSQSHTLEVSCSF